VALSFASPRWTFSTFRAQRAAFDFSDTSLTTPNGDQKLTKDGHIQIALDLPIQPQTHANPDGSTYRYPHAIELHMIPGGPRITLELPGSRDPRESVYVGLWR
jgi:hypothetical protein